MSLPPSEQPAPATSVSAGHTDVITDDDRAAVVAAGVLRRRLALARRIVPTLLVVVGVGWCGVDLAVSLGSSGPCGAQQSEAKGNLKALSVSIQSTRAEDEKAPLTFASVGFRPRGKDRYRFALTDVGAGESPDFVGWAFRADGVIDDVWTIDREGTPKNIAGCAR